MVRTPGYDKNGLKKGTWTAEEDRKLIAYVTKHGCPNWRQLPKYAGLSRCGKSCRLRWVNYLHPNVKRGNYSKEEDDMIVKLHDSLGNRWSVIAAHLPGRTDNEVKNRWHAYLKNRAKQRPHNHFKRGSHIQEKNTTEHKNPPLDHVIIHNILESSRISPQVSSTESSSDFVTKFAAEDDGSSLEVVEQTTGDFWTEPFLEDINHNINVNTSGDQFLVTLIELGLLSPIVGEESLLFHGLPELGLLSPIVGEESLLFHGLP